MRAYHSLDHACSFAVDAGLRSQILSLIKSLEESGEKMLAAGDKHFAAGKHSEAMRLYRTVATMGKLNAGANARAKINKAQGHPILWNIKAAAVYSTIHDILKCSTDPEEIELKADALEDGGTGAGLDEADVEAHVKRAFEAPITDQVRLMATLDQLMTTYGSTPSGRLAERLRDKLMDDAVFSATIEQERKDDQLRSGLEWGQQHEKAGLLAKAVEAYKKVIADGPGTDWAIKAKKRIEEIERAEKRRSSKS